MVSQLKTRKSFESFVSYTRQIRSTFGSLIKTRTSPSQASLNSQTIYPQGYVAYLKTFISVSSSNNKFESLLNQELENLMKRTRLPLAMKPKIIINSPKNFFFDRASRSYTLASYDTEENVIEINSEYAKNITVINEFLNHEFKHFLDSLEIKKLEYQEPEILMENIEEFLRELQQGKVLAFQDRDIDLNELKNYLINQFPEVQKLVKSYQENPYLRLIDKEIIKKLQEISQYQLEKLEIPESIDLENFKKQYLEQIQSKFTSEALFKELIETRIDYILKDFNNSNSRDKYAYLTKLNTSKIPKATNHLKGFLEHLANCADYQQNTYEKSQDEASARILEYSFLIKDLLNKNPDLKAKIQARPNRQKPIDTQNEEWLEDLKKTQDGNNLLKYATNLRANSLLFQVSKSLKNLITSSDTNIPTEASEKIRNLSKLHAQLIRKLSKLDENSIKDFDLKEVIKSGTIPETRSQYIRQDHNQRIYISRNLPLEQIIVLLGYEKLKNTNQAWIIGDAIEANNYKKGMKNLEDSISADELAMLKEEATIIKLGLTTENYPLKKSA